MPPFSGKKKKEQLQAKRQRKRDEEERSKKLDREREKMREELLKRGMDTSDAILDTLMREQANLQDPEHGRRARRREKENTAGHGTMFGGDNEDDESGSRASLDDSDSERGDKLRHSAPRTMMYSADRQHGVRSIFVKESAATIAARKQLSYQPIPCRTTMPPTGIPFGEWFTFPSSASSVAAAVPAGENGARMDSEEKLALIAAEQQRRMERPLVASAGEALGGVSSSTCFPFVVELPSRGWHVRADDNEVVTDASIVMAGVDRTSTQLQSDPSRAATSQAAVGDPANPASEVGQKLAVCAGQRSSSNDVARVAGSNEVDGFAAQASGAPPKERKQHDAQCFKSIEESRLAVYAGCVDAYPLPSALVGLEVNSYERNVEVWQQLWRTVELSDVLVVVADARYPIIHAHLGLLTYITKEQRKPCVFVLNKEDLVPASTLRCWQQFLYRYLNDLGFSVEPPDTREQSAEMDFACCRSEGVAQRGSASGCIVLRTFTACPRPETAGQRDGDVDVTRRQKNRKKVQEHMYEKLRSGRLNVAKHLGGSQRGAGAGNDDDESEEDDELRYDATEVFVGMQAAQRALQKDCRAYKELEVVAGRITELLATCRRLGTAARSTAHGINTTAAEQVHEASSSSSLSPTYATSSLPCTAPRAAHKRKRAQKRSSARRGGGGRGNGGVGSAFTGDNSGSEKSDDVVEGRAPDSPSYLHIGFVGYPNVGKSSLLNCIRGTKVVSVSATPGHTKHMQTIPVPEEHLTLVDSPGLALPAFGVPRPLQAVLGTHQIAQTRDPQTSISFLAAYLPIEKMYGLQRPEHALPEVVWSSYELCEAYARKRGFFVKHGKGALDVHRSAIALLQEAYEGRLALFYAPPELNLLQSAWYRERIRPYLLFPVFKPALLSHT
ncbi:guanine nucleotide-binding protein-like protein [Leishmania tarentolae]|uniref:Guanine nucleotide-binding protein-like 1 n=1 Tax=Leishmania tarentolae TaxID=5689 RepID=A0A640KPV2_LEITA|nr:guanine nucleotide-binding protein-like protein [Leishmania tarentolae]